ncbi:MAG TPA: hypothetical protein PKA77_05790 [Chitinophagaceae bacterium]|jgi:hypothetical protein|nr:hypothetical protein [Saprospiraceae bacterium]HMT73555.1 hypothetical protein [Chitinophagaceae bacterium]
MNTERLQSLANTDFTKFIQSENNVKYKIIIPFLQAFSHVDLDLEHAAQGSRIDINIGNRIIVETKALGQNLNMHIQQLSDYCGKELPVLAILTNGRQFRIYSPQWRHLRTFAEKIIYQFELKDLNDSSLLKRLEKILDFSNYNNLEFIEHIEQREKEIFKIKSQIEDLKVAKKNEVSEIKNEIEILKNQIQELLEQVKLKERFVSDIENGRIPEIETLAVEYLIPFLVTKSEMTPSSYSINTPPPPLADERAEATRLKVIFSDGQVINESKAIDTLIMTIQRFGIEKVRDLPIIKGVPFISDKPINEGDKKRYKKIGNTPYYINVNHGTPRKKEYLEKIARLLNEAITVQVE